MALIKCPECGKDLSTAAKACPHCGFAATGTGESYISLMNNETAVDNRKTTAECPECKHELKDFTFPCPNCGHKKYNNYVPNHKNEDSIIYTPSKLSFVFLALAVFGFVVAIGLFLVLLAYGSNDTTIYVSATIATFSMSFCCYVFYSLFDRLNTIGLMLNRKNENPNNRGVTTQNVNNTQQTVDETAIQEKGKEDSFKPALIIIAVAVVLLVLAYFFMY